MCLTFEPPHDKTNNVTVCPAKTQISLGIRPVWSESSLCAQWVPKDPSFLHADSEDWSDWADAQADLSLRWAHNHTVGFVMRRLIFISFQTGKIQVTSQQMHLFQVYYIWTSSRENLSLRYSDQVRLKPACSATETSYYLGILDSASIGIILSRQRTTKALIRLPGCADWSAPLLFAYEINRFSHDVAQLCLLAHLSRRLTRWAYSIPMVRRPSSSVVVRRPHFQTWISLKPVGQSWSNIMCSIIGVGKGCIRFWWRLNKNSGFHGNRKPPLTYNGENDVSTFSRLFLIRSFLYLQVTRTCIKSRTSSNFGQIGPLSMELAALERLIKVP